MSKKQPLMSLVLCTRDRAKQLSSFFEKLPLAKISENNVEIVLVDSDSQDETFSLMEQFKSNHPALNIKIVKSNKPGLGFARNLGIKNASSDIMIFADDDCYYADDYMMIASKVFDHKDKFKFCGGRILLFDPTDAQVGCNFENNYKLYPGETKLLPGQFQGANLIVHRDVFDKVGGFDPELGAGKRFRFEDIDLLARAALAGFAGAHVPDLVVYHHHGRKDGHDLDIFKQQNDYARGAFYSKMVLLGYFDYLKIFANSYKNHGARKWIALNCEIKGFFSYMFDNFLRKFQS